ncbi:hypothetical protein SDC9_176862 [bioreactor metagenome]|uniref:Uncharacterized protein n=1 Tax=bioreactor metagenome TaxID=1076179 RepID=A0A645GUH2_9ZZZZ
MNRDRPAVDPYVAGRFILAVFADDAVSPDNNRNGSAADRDTVLSDDAVRYRGYIQHRISDHNIILAHDAEFVVSVDHQGACSVDRQVTAGKDRSVRIVSECILRVTRSV